MKICATDPRADQTLCEAVYEEIEIAEALPEACHEQSSGKLFSLCKNLHQCLTSSRGDTKSCVRQDVELAWFLDKPDECVNPKGNFAYGCSRIKACLLRHGGDEARCRSVIRKYFN